MRVLLVTSGQESDDMLADRLRMQGHEVDVAAAPAEGARMALNSPPDVVVADLWMPRISGMQLCLLLRSEVATEGVPVVLRGPDGPRHRFWAETAGAVEYVVRGRTVDLVRALDRIAAKPKPADDDMFFTQLDGSTDVRDRIAAHLDAALFESAIAGEIRALSSSRSLARLFDRLCQFLSRVSSYRWFALTTTAGTGTLMLHATPKGREVAEAEARAVLGVQPDVARITIEDEDPKDDPNGAAPIVRDIVLDGEKLGTFALAQSDGERALDRDHMGVVARELASPLRMAMLLEELASMARTDPLTGVLNRRSFDETLAVEIARASRFGYSIALAIVDLDHFKSINDTYGHATGDVVLKRVARVLKQGIRNVDVVARWGGEEFVVALCGTNPDGMLAACERLRMSIERLQTVSEGREVRVTASFGVSMLGASFDDALERADRALYAAKESGRNRVMSTDRASDSPASAVLTTIGFRESEEKRPCATT